MFSFGLRTMGTTLRNNHCATYIACGKIQSELSDNAKEGVLTSKYTVITDHISGLHYKGEH